MMRWNVKAQLNMLFTLVKFCPICGNHLVHEENLADRKMKVCPNQCGYIYINGDCNSPEAGACFRPEENVYVHFTRENKGSSSTEAGA